MNNCHELSIEFDRSSVVLCFGKVERETAGGHYRATALMTESVDGVSWIADIGSVEVLVGKEWLKTDLPLDEKAKVAEYLQAEAEREQAENEMFEELEEA